MTDTPTPARTEEPHVPLSDVEELLDVVIAEVKAARHDTRAQTRRHTVELLTLTRNGLREAALGALVNDAMPPGDTSSPTPDPEENP